MFQPCYFWFLHVFVNCICRFIEIITELLILGFVCRSPAPCIPKNLQTSADCSSDVLLSKWDLAEGALRYTVEAFGNKGKHNRYNCSSMSNSCAIEGVHCGDYLTIYITAYDDECASPRTLGPAAETGKDYLSTMQDKRFRF